MGICGCVQVINTDRKVNSSIHKRTELLITRRISLRTNVTVHLSKVRKAAYWQKTLEANLADTDLVHGDYSRVTPHRLPIQKFT